MESDRNILELLTSFFFFSLIDPSFYLLLYFLQTHHSHKVNLFTCVSHSLLYENIFEIIKIYNTFCFYYLKNAPASQLTLIVLDYPVDKWRGVHKTQG